MRDVVNVLNDEFAAALDEILQILEGDSPNEYTEELLMIGQNLAALVKTKRL
jgi:hypothetical protein